MDTDDSEYSPSSAIKAARKKFTVARQKADARASELETISKEKQERIAALSRATELERVDAFTVARQKADARASELERISKEKQERIAKEKQDAIAKIAN
jgi:hypothetical protein